MKSEKLRLSASLASFVLVASIGCVSTAQAIVAAHEIELSDPASGQDKIAAGDKDFNPLGIHAGGFYLYPAIEIGVMADDNIFRIPDKIAESDVVTNLRGSVSINSNWNRHELNFIASADLGYYKDFDSEDYKDYVVATNGRYDVMRDSFATGKAGYMRQHEDRSSLDDRFGTTPTEYDLSYIGAGYDHQPGKVRTLFTVNYQKLDYQDVFNILGEEVNNDDRDRTRPEALLRFGYENMPNRRIFIEGKVNAVDYDQRFDDNGAERSSNGYKVTTGMNFDLTHLLVGDVFVGYVEQKYDDPRFSDISDGLFGFGLTWMPTGLTTVGFNLDKSPQETTEPTASGYLSTVFSVSLKHELMRNLMLSGNIGYTDNNYGQNAPGQKENENISNFGLGAKYSFNRRFYATADYRYQKRSSDIAIQEYKLNQGMLAIGANW